MVSEESYKHRSQMIFRLTLAIESLAQVISLSSGVYKPNRQNATAQAGAPLLMLSAPTGAKQT